MLALGKMSKELALGRVFVRYTDLSLEQDIVQKKINIALVYRAMDFSPSKIFPAKFWRKLAA